jgi:hypothetical protein
VSFRGSDVIQRGCSNSCVPEIDTYNEQDESLLAVLVSGSGALQNGPPRAMCIPCLAQETKHKYEEGLNKAANATRADIKGKAGKEERSSGPTCTEPIGDGVDDDVVLIGEIAEILPALSVSRSCTRRL